MQKKVTQVNLSSVLFFLIFYCFFDLYIGLWGKSAWSKSALELFKGSFWAILGFFYEKSFFFLFFKMQFFHDSFELES